MSMIYHALAITKSTPFPVTGLVVGIVLVGYITYQRYFHPLAKFPGPLLASLTNWWKVYYIYHQNIHEVLIALHEKHGPIIRVGPNDLHFWNAEAIEPIYKAGRSMPKTEFYDAFTTFNPNLFGTTDENQHSLRRRQLAHGFSLASAREMEPILDEQMRILCDRLDECVTLGKVFDLKDYIASCIFDGLGEIAFARSFQAQKTTNPKEFKAISDHLLLASLVGQLPFQRLSKALIAWSPIPWMKRLIVSRALLKQQCENCVEYRVEHPSNRKDLLHSLIKAKDPETGAGLSRLDINTEAFAMLVAGSHSTAGTLGMMFYNLLKNPRAMENLVDEIDRKLPALSPGQPVYQFDELESLEQLTACIRENFRMDPVFTMTLWRRVSNPAGVSISGQHIPNGTNVCIVNYTLHHNPAVWGFDQHLFDPQRWLDARAKDKARFLLPFSIGHRTCIGRNVATIELYKTISTLMKKYQFILAEPHKNQRLRSSGIGELEGELRVRVAHR